MSTETIETIPYYSVDVQLVATGKTCTERTLAYIGIVNEKEELLLSCCIKPKKQVISYFTPHTGLQEKDLQNGEEFEVAIQKSQDILKNGKIIAQSTRDVIQFLQLTER
jgi:hypothetical protein